MSQWKQFGWLRKDVGTTSAGPHEGGLIFDTTLGRPGKCFITATRKNTFPHSSLRTAATLP